jgi:hypothetical protein
MLQVEIETTQDLGVVREVPIILENYLATEL